MKLNLALAGKVLASVAVDPARCSDDYYLKAFRRMLIIRYHRKLKSASSSPQFVMEQTVAGK